MRRHIATFAALALALALAGGATAEPPRAGPGGPPRRGPPPIEAVLERYADRLGLDAETRAEIERIASAAREEARALQETLRARHAEMRALLASDTPDQAAAMAQADRVGAAETALHKHRLRTMLEIRALLTPEQRQELVRIHEERRARRGSHRDGAPPPPPPHLEDGPPPEDGPAFESDAPPPEADAPL